MNPRTTLTSALLVTIGLSIVIPADSWGDSGAARRRRLHRARAQEAERRERAEQTPSPILQQPKDEVSSSSPDLRGSRSSRNGHPDLDSMKQVEDLDPMEPAEEYASAGGNGRASGPSVPDVAPRDIAAPIRLGPRGESGPFGSFSILWLAVVAGVAVYVSAIAIWARLAKSSH
jgi:hypothetical protein